MPSTKPATTTTTSTAASTQTPAGWSAKHDAFVRAAASRGEDKKSIACLLEAEFPSLGHVSDAHFNDGYDMAHWSMRANFKGWMSSFLGSSPGVRLIGLG
ncbi:hypothetical protein MMC10_008359 [Thelotrema lepadinum]|nr:hypothetical protein [Thelotrema lepadinum]